MNESELAKWLANTDGDGATDEEFAEFFVKLYLIWNNKKDPKENLTADDMKNFDTLRFTTWLKEVLDEIIFLDEVDASAWWKNN